MKHAPTPPNLAKSLVLQLYDMGWKLALPALRLNSRLRAGFEERTVRHRPGPADLWIQAASAGESYLTEVLLARLRLPDPLRIMVTSGTREGVEILKQAVHKGRAEGKSFNISAGYFPFDKPTVMERAVAGIRPRVTVFLESEIWPGLFAALKREGSRILIVNGRMTKKSLSRYLLWPSFWQDLGPDRVLAVSRTDAARFAALFGKDRVEVMKNMKFDRIGRGELEDCGENPLREMLASGAAFVVLGSIRRQEEGLVKKIVADVVGKEPRVVIGLFPRHLPRIGYWKNALDDLGLSWCLRSQVKGPVPEGTVVLWDVFAELHRAYGVARAAFVGGSLAPLGGQNFLEPLLCGVIPVIGPSWENFAWAGQEILDQGLVRRALGWQDVADLLVRDVRGPRPRQEVRQGALAYVEAHQGGTERACRLIRKSLDQVDPRD